MSTLAVLISGGLDSAILLGAALRQGDTVQPIFVRCGLVWEAVELTYLKRYLEARACPALRPLTVLEQPVGDLYGNHWSMTGQGVPDASAPDEEVYLPGRNVLLLAKPLLWCHLHGVSALALGSLPGNPFADATPEFFAALSGAVSMAVTGSVAVRLPFAGMTKTEVMHLSQGLPLAHTFSCMQPYGALHCGRCNKCAERRRAFATAGLADPTTYGL